MMITNWKLVTAGTAVTGLALGALVGFATDDEAVDEIDLIRSTERTLDNDDLRRRTNLDRMVVSDSPAVDDVAPDAPVRRAQATDSPSSDPPDRRAQADSPDSPAPAPAPAPDSPASPADSPSPDSPDAAPVREQSSRVRAQAPSPDSPEPATAPAPDSPDSPASGSPDS